MVDRYFPIEEYEKRRARVLAEMKARGHEVAVIWGRGAGGHERGQDTLYLTNYYSSASGQEPDNALLNGRAFCALILSEGEEPELHVDLPGRRDDLFAIDRVVDHYDPIQGVARALNARNVEGEVALVGTDFLPHLYFEQLQSETPQITWKQENDLVRTVRRIKSWRELECYREGGEIATRAITRYIEGLISGRSEADAAADAAGEIIRSGGAFLMLPCNHGDTMQFWCRQPQTGYSTDSPRSGELVRAWLLGPIHQGYYLDPGRTAVCGGKPSDGQRDLVEATANIVETIVSEVRPGRSIMDLAKIGESMSRDAGGGGDQTSEQWPLYGHALGLFWEDPYISTKMCTEHDRVENGMVFGIEAFIGQEGVGAAGFEQNILVEDGRVELLTPAPMIWW